MAKPRKTPTKEQKEWMNTSGYSEAQLDEFWNNNIDTNPIIRNLNAHGMTWRDMNLSCVMQLPTQKERDLKTIAEREVKEQAERVAKEKAEREKAYYYEHFPEIMVEKIDSGEQLTKEELTELIWGYDVDTQYGDNRRWSRSVTTIIELNGRYFSISWEEGLTEYQDNEYNSQPVEVKKHTYEKTITVTEWVECKAYE